MWRLRLFRVRGGALVGVVLVLVEMLLRSVNIRCSPARLPRELANLCPDDITEAYTAADAGLRRVGSDYQLCHAFLDHTSLRL